jgi:hypothetical protein
MFTKNRLSILSILLCLAVSFPPAATWARNLSSLQSASYVQPACQGNVVLNSDFEQGNTIWTVRSTSSGPKPRTLIDQYLPHDGLFDARLGGVEGTVDEIKQEVVIPENAHLTYWWRMGTYETLPHHDALYVRLLDGAGNVIAYLAIHDDQSLRDQWVQDGANLSTYAGQSLWLDFYSYNDNYYFSWWDIDSICLTSSVYSPYLNYLPHIVR